MNVLGSTILLIVLMVVSFAPRRWAVIGFMAGVLYLTQGQSINLMGFNMFAIRFIGLAAFIRVLARKEFSFARLNRIDVVLLILYGYSTIVFILRSKEGQAYQIGTAVDAIFCYFAFRGLISDFEGLNWFLHTFLILLIPYVALVLYESVTGQKLFASMGAINLTGSEWFRNGRIRCQGSFRHPSLLGTVGASFLPMYIGACFRKGHRRRAILGGFLCLAIVWASNSGAPASCAGVALLGWFMWKVRVKMRSLRWIACVLLVLITISMKAPVWYLLAKVSDITGGDGYHRSHLMDMAFQNLDKWGIAGMPIEATSGWFPYELAATGGADMTNQFLAFAISAGAIAMMLFIVLLVYCFKNIGKSLTICRNNGDNNYEWVLWGLGVMLSVHIFNWLGITYFDQTYAIWFFQLAIISNLTEKVVSNNSSLAGHDYDNFKYEPEPL